MFKHSGVAFISKNFGIGIVKYFIKVSLEITIQLGFRTGRNGIDELPRGKHGVSMNYKFYLNSASRREFNPADFVSSIAHSLKSV